MDNLREQVQENLKYQPTIKDDFNTNNSKEIIEIVNEEELKKNEAYLEWEQEYYVINQSYLLENI